ncbi:MAG: EpsG family protein [Clostridiales bacterium]|nr:EpsG family protein [Clostridiales bacterium]
MLIYVFILIALMIGLFIKNRKFKNFYEKFLIFLLIIVAGIRIVGTDFMSYKFYYLNIDSDVCKRLDVGCKFIMNISYFIFKENYAGFFMLSSAITLICIYNTLKKEKKNVMFSIILFVLLGFYANSFNIMKQCISLAITFWSIRYLNNKTPIKYCMCIFIAACIHQTSIIMLPFYWISKKKITKKSFIKISVISIILLLFFDKFFNIFTSIEQYKMYNTYDIGIDAGIGTYLNIMFFGTLQLLCVLRYKNLIKINDKNKQYINIMIFSIPFLLVSIKNVLFFRMSLYFLIYLIMVLPDLFDGMERKCKYLVAFILLIVCITYYFMNIYYFGGLYPYKSIFSIY